MRLLLLAAATTLAAVAASSLRPSSASSREVLLSCGKERWPVKTLTDAQATSVDFRHVRSSTVTALGRLPAPKSLPPTRLARERRLYRIHARLVEFKLEQDEDIHVVVADVANATSTMIVEFPNSDCTRGAQHRYAMARARAALTRACGNPPLSHFQTLSGPATITGVLFFDFNHRQRGVAPNAAELHPALSFRLGSASC